MKKKFIPTPNVNQTDKYETNIGSGMSKDNQSIREPELTNKNNRQIILNLLQIIQGNLINQPRKPSTAKSAVEYLSKTGKNVLHLSR